MKKPALLLAALALAGTGLTACGGDDAESAPTNASKKDFCGVLVDFAKKASTMDSASEKEQIDAAHDLADDMTEVGTPEDMPKEARDTYVKLVDALKSVKNTDDADKEFKGLDNAELTKYMTTACADAFKDAIPTS